MVLNNATVKYEIRQPMAQDTTDDRLNTALSALADPTRRAIVERLKKGPATVSELAEPFDMTLPAVSRHVKVLVRAGLVEQGRVAQWRPCTLRTEPLREVAGWVESFRETWEGNFDRLEELLGRLDTPHDHEEEER